MLSSDHLQLVDPSVFGHHRQRMVSLGVRILHSVPDSEDVVQEAWLRWRQSSCVSPVNPEAYLTTIVTRLSLTNCGAATTDARTAGGSPSAADRRSDPQLSVELAADVAEAHLLMLQRLSPGKGRRHAAGHSRRSRAERTRCPAARQPR
jgi:RNA polymerase sigma-70 factor, ECF subfamily